MVKKGYGQGARQKVVKKGCGQGVGQLEGGQERLWAGCWTEGDQERL